MTVHKKRLKELRQEYEKLVTNLYLDDPFDKKPLVISWCDAPLEAAGQFYLDGRVDLGWRVFVSLKLDIQWRIIITKKSDSNAAIREQISPSWI